MTFKSEGFFTAPFRLTVGERDPFVNSNSAPIITGLSCVNFGILFMFPEWLQLQISNLMCILLMQTDIHKRKTRSRGYILNFRAAVNNSEMAKPIGFICRWHVAMLMTFSVFRRWSPCRCLRSRQL